MLLIDDKKQRGIVGYDVYKADMAGPAIIASRSDLAHLVVPIEDLEVSTCVVNQLGITHGDQTVVLVAFVKKVRHDPFVSASVYLGKDLGYEHFRIVKEYDCPHSPSGCYIFFVDKLSGNMMYFGAETIDFRQC